MREEFEKLPEIAKVIKEHDAFYCDKGDYYLCPDDDQFAEAYLDGALYAYQQQQKKIDQLLEIINAGLKIEQNMNNQIHSLKEKIDTAIEYLDSVDGLVWYEKMKELLK